jgi:hypothetical protein
MSNATQFNRQNGIFMRSDGSRVSISNKWFMRNNGDEVITASGAGVIELKDAEGASTIPEGTLFAKIQCDKDLRVRFAGVPDDTTGILYKAGEVIELTNALTLADSANELLNCFQAYISEGGTIQVQYFK